MVHVNVALRVNKIQYEQAMQNTTYLFATINYTVKWKNNALSGLVVELP